MTASDTDVLVSSGTCADDFTFALGATWFLCHGESFLIEKFMASSAN